MSTGYSPNGDYGSRVLRGTLRQCERWLRTYSEMSDSREMQRPAIDAEKRFRANAAGAHRVLNAFFPNPLPGTEASALKLKLARAERRFVDLCGSSRYRSADDYLRSALEECSSLADKGRYDDAWGAMDSITAQFIKNRSRPVPLGRVRKMASEALCTHRYIENGDAAAHVT